jgi:hypothetical protein
MSDAHDAFIALQCGEYSMPKHTVRPNHSESKVKYVLVIDRSDKKGGVKRIKFRQRDAAIRLAELLDKRRTKVKVLFDGREIFPRR